MKGHPGRPMKRNAVPRLGNGPSYRPENTAPGSGRERTVVP